MKFRHTMKRRRAVAAVAIATGLLLMVAGCGGGDGGKTDEKASSSAPSQTQSGGDEKTESSAPAAEPALAEVKSGDITLTVTSAVRDQGGFATVNGTVTNSGGKFWVAGDWLGDENELIKNGPSLAGASLVDSKAKKKYLVLRDTDGRCLCTKFEGGGVDTGQTADWFAQFPAPPEGSNQVNFQVGTMPPASIEISEGE
ncbi:hypothetical protein [Streptomyces sp. SID12488]|uniref:hypothetical protein n=1 Tax=Streptomyces sp. SID12488 TaxID=2706040 RepID=UPI0013DD4885|nr:hypothetical protein [Streptomyces sp. SID12488]NEA62535.1 hypothetical protein [Streptomyces sp. SID12488]